MINGHEKAFSNEFNKERGLSKREYFAALALQGLLSIYDNREALIPNFKNTKYMAELAVTAADELIKQLNTKP